MVEGYKHTEVGMIPEDWELLPFTDIAELKHGFQFQEEHFSKTGIGIVKIGTLNKNAGLDFTRLTYTSYKNRKRFNNFLLNRGDVLMALTGATLGKVAKVDTDRILFQNYRVGNFLPNNKTTRDYLYHISQSKLIQKTVMYLVNEAAQPNLGKSDFKNIKIPIPSLPEQQAIAEVLSDTDKLIQTLEKRIAKKRNIKQGAMQKLLTPKEDWETKKLGDFSIVGRGRVISHKEIALSTQMKYPVYSSQTSNNGIMGYIDTYDFDGEYITWTTDGVYAGKVYYRNGKFNCTNVCGTIKLLQEDALFVSIILDTLTSKYVSTNLANPKLMNDPVKKIEVPLPTISEQNRIATILSDMDKEIEQLEEKLDKYKDVKKGLMQQLLTGKIRLI